jgi:hypothetical protein
MAIDKSHGAILRRFGDAVSDIVDNLVFGTGQGDKVYGIEQVELSRVMDCRAGSDELLQLISS